MKKAALGKKQRTSVALRADLVRRCKRVAVAEHRSFTNWVEKVMRDALRDASGGRCAPTG